MNRTQDVLYVRTFPAEKKALSERIVVDFEESPLTDKFIVLQAEGGTIVLGAERVTLGWEALSQLAELLQTGAKTLKVTQPPPRH